MQLYGFHQGKSRIKSFFFKIFFRPIKCRTETLLLDHKGLFRTHKNHRHAKTYRGMVYCDLGLYFLLGPILSEKKLIVKNLWQERTVSIQGVSSPRFLVKPNSNRLLCKYFCFFSKFFLRCAEESCILSLGFGNEVFGWHV